MWGRKRSPVEQATDALGTLGARVAGAAGSVTGNGDPGRAARKAQKNAGKALAQAAQNADVAGKAAAAGGLMRMLGSRVGDAAHEAQKNVGNNGFKISIDANDVPRLLRGTTLLATGLGTLFAPGSPLDASRRPNASGGEIADQAREGIDTAADLTQQRIKDIVDLAKDALSSLSDALTSGIETAESKAQQALDETEKSLTKATEEAAKQAKKSLPKQKGGGGSVRWLFLGLLVGGGAAFVSSPLAGPLGERVANLRRDLGLGGDADDDSQYWPSPPPEATTAGTGTASDTTSNGSSGTETTESTDQA